MKKGIWALIGVVALVAIVVIIRAVAPQVPPPIPQVVEGKLVVGGSSSVYVVAVYLAERFMEKHPDVVVEILKGRKTSYVEKWDEGLW